MRHHELLAPAGSLEIAKAVLDAGADAVYLAGESFGARAYAANLSREDLAEVLDYAHLRNKKVHLTVNTLLKNRELEETLFSYIRPVYEHGLDAVIVQDFGVLSFLHRNFPDLSLHASTQMSVTTRYGANFLKDCGVERIVTARELTLEEIRTIHEQTGMEIESFIHGALCYCFSGQCLMSSMFGGRSGNRGRCAQPCRLPYGIEDAQGRPYGDGARFPLSPKDLCAIDLFPDLCEAGVYSFKIEGRMKQIEYARGVTEIYRAYLDLYEQDPEGYQVDPKDRDRLLALGNRSGFTKGYYQKPWDRRMLSDRDSSHTGQKTGMDTPERSAVGKPVADMTAYLKPGEQVQLFLSSNGRSVQVSGDPVQEAAKRPLLADDVIKRLGKTGDSAFQSGRIHTEIEGDCFLPVASLNRIRRDGLEELKRVLLTDSRRVCTETAPVFAGRPKKEEKRDQPKLIVQITSEEMLQPVLSAIVPDLIFLDTGSCGKDRLSRMVSRIREKGSRAGFCMPYCLREERTVPYRELLAQIPFDQYLARSYDSLGFLLDCGIEKDRIRLDAGVYVFSCEAAASFWQKGIRHYTLSYELNRNELRHQQMQGAMLSVYGRIPLMTSAQCIYRNYAGCRKETSKNGNEALYLKDRYENRFFIDVRCEDCYNIIYNSRPQYILDHLNGPDRLFAEAYRISFTTETGQEIGQILSDLVSGDSRFDDRYTRGHFNRGVE